MLVRVDELVLAVLDGNSIMQMNQKFDETCDELNIKISVDKNITNAAKFELYVFHFNSTSKTVSLSNDKFGRITSALEEAIKFKWMTSRVLESSCRKLMH